MVALKENNTVAVWFLETAKCLGRANVQLRAERFVSHTILFYLLISNTTVNRVQSN